MTPEACGQSLLRQAGSPEKRIVAAILVSVVIAFVSVVINQCFADNFPFDFAYFHAAGRAWAAGVDPYGPGFADFARPFIPPQSALWVYPPQWWSITVALGSIPIGTAMILWKGAGLLALMIGGSLVFDVFKERVGAAWPMTAIVFSFVLASADSSWINLKIGQSGLFAILGLALILHGLRFQGRKRMAIGIVILLLKPAFGLFMLLMLARQEHARRSVVLALAGTLVACLPILVTLGSSATLESAQNFLTGLSAYDDQPWNRPGSLTGITLLTAIAGLPSPPAVLTIFMAWAAAATLFRRATARGFAIEPVDRCLVGTATFLAVVPLHHYDQALLPLFLLMLGQLRAWASISLAAAMFLSWRVASFAFAIHGEQTSTVLPGVYSAALMQAAIGTMAASLVLVAIVFGRRDQQARLVQASPTSPGNRNPRSLAAS